MPYKDLQVRRKFAREYAKKNPEVNRRAQEKYRSTEKFKETRKRYQPTHYARYGRKWRIMKEFGMSLAQFEEMKSKQGNRCAICGNPPKKRALAIDHDHSTGKIRGMLCYPCNVVLGLVSDSIVTLDRMIEYLKKHDELL